MMNQIKQNVLLLASLYMSIFRAFADPSTDEKAIAHLGEFRKDYTRYMLDREPEKITGYFSEDIRLMPAFQKTVIGKENVRHYHQVFIDRFEVREYSRKEVEILDLGDQVMEVGTLAMKLIRKNTGQEYELAGAYLNIWIKDSDHLYLITEAWNFDRYYEGIDQLLRFEEVPAVLMAFQPNVTIDSPISFELAAMNRLLDVTVTQHDATVWKQYYAEDGMLIPNYHPICRGKESIDEYIEKHVKELPVFEGLDIRNDRIDDLGIYVIEYASHIASWRNGENSGVSTGKNIRIWRRASDHSLKLFRSIGMYD